MKVQVFSGASIGLLLGLLMGLSTSPVVALVVGAFAALLGVVVLPQAKGSSNDATPARHEAAAWRASALSCAAILGLFVGLWMRTHDVLSAAQPTLAQQIAALKDAGFGPEEAKRLVASREFPEPRTAPSVSPAITTPNHRLGVLFATDAATCERLKLSNFKSVAVAAQAYEATGFRSLASYARSLQNELDDDGQRKVALVAVVGAICAAP